MNNIASQILKIQAVVLQNLTGMSVKFKNENHDIYYQWLRERLVKILNDEVIKSVLASIGIDWLTLHYHTRNATNPWSVQKNWLQVGLPCSDYMERIKEKIQVYKNGESPYISYFSRQENFNQQSNRPIYIEITETDSEIETDSLSLLIQRNFIDYCTTLTNGQEKQENFTDSEVEKCKDINKTHVDSIVRLFSTTSNKNILEEEAMGYFRNTCRATLLALKTKTIRLPRIIILVPIYVEENLIGGIAFLGNAHIGENSMQLLHLLAQTILTTVRLREEPYRESKIQTIEELNRAQADFVQRISHRLFTPLDDLWYTVDSSIKKLAKIREYVEYLKKEASEIMLAFSKNNIDEFLVVKPSKEYVYDFFKTLKFIYEEGYKKKGVELIIKQIPENWIFYIDTHSIMEVFSNLLSNARKYAKNSVIIEVIKGKDNYVISVTDDGIGVDPNIIERLFEPGVTDTRDGQTHETNHHGYGLYHSRRVIQKHGGDMFLNKEVEDKTQFTVIFPVLLKNTDAGEKSTGQ